MKYSIHVRATLEADEGTEEAIIEAIENALKGEDGIEQIEIIHLSIHS